MNRGTEEDVAKLIGCAEQLVAKVDRIENLIEPFTEGGRGGREFRMMLDTLRGMVDDVILGVAEFADASAGVTHPLLDPLLEWTDAGLHRIAGEAYMKPPAHQSHESLEERGERLWEAFEKAIKRDCPPEGSLFQTPAKEVLARFPKKRGKPRAPIRCSVFARYWLERRGAVAGQDGRPRRGLKKDKS